MKMPYVLTKEYAKNKQRGKFVLRLVMLLFVIAVLSSGCSNQEREKVNSEKSESSEISEIMESSETIEERENETEHVSETPAYDENTLEGIIKSIVDDGESTAEYLLEEYEKLRNTVGNTYEGYVENKEMIEAYYELISKETEELFARTYEKSKEYYKLIVATIDPKNDGTIDDAMENYYDVVCDDFYDDYYDDIVDDLFDELYDDYYDGVLEDAYDRVEYKEWSDESTEAYRVWSNASSDVYRLWSDSSSKIDRVWSDVDSAFWNNNFDIDEVLEIDKESKEE